MARFISMLLLATGLQCSGQFFSVYKDATTNLNWNTNVLSTQVTGSLQDVLTTMPDGLETLTWAFATGECNSEKWGGVEASSIASANVNAWAKAGKKYIVSTGGALGSFTCGSDSDFTSFLQRYTSSSLLGFDFDIETSQTQEQVNALAQRVKTARAQSQFAGLRWSWTVATLGADTTGENLGAAGLMVINALKTAGLDWTDQYINLMAMDYGTSSSVCTLKADGTCDMAQSAINAAKSLHTVHGVPYANIELTPMIGMNDVVSNVFTLADVNTLVAWAKSNGLGGLHHWSYDRDVDCTSAAASSTCNSYGAYGGAGSLGFTKAFLTAMASPTAKTGEMPVSPMLRGASPRLSVPAASPVAVPSRPQAQQRHARDTVTKRAMIPQEALGNSVQQVLSGFAESNSAASPKPLAMFGVLGAFVLLMVLG